MDKREKPPILEHVRHGECSLVQAVCETPVGHSSGNVVNKKLALEVDKKISFLYTYACYVQP